MINLLLDLVKQYTLQGFTWNSNDCLVLEILINPELTKYNIPHQSAVSHSKLGPKMSLAVKVALCERVKAERK